MKKLNKVKLNEAKSKVQQLSKAFSDALDLNEIPSTFDAIASCLLELGLFDDKAKRRGLELSGVLKLLTEEGLISNEASEIAEELQEFSEVTGYVGEIDQELEEANLLRSSLHELLNNAINAIEARLL